ESGFTSIGEVARTLSVKPLGILPRLSARRSRWFRGRTDDHSCATDLGAGRAVHDQPRSRFAETVRAVKQAATGAIESGTGSCVIGIVSALPEEGKATLCTSLAQALGEAGASVLMLDADLRDSALTRTLAPRARLGLAEVLSGEAELGAAILRDPLSKG